MASVGKRPFKCRYTIKATAQQAIRIQFNYIGLHTDLLTCFYRKDKHQTMDDYIEVLGTKRKSSFQKSNI